MSFLLLCLSMSMSNVYCKAVTMSITIHIRTKYRSMNFYFNVNFVAIKITLFHKTFNPIEVLKCLIVRRLQMLDNMM